MTTNDAVPIARPRAEQGWTKLQTIFRLRQAATRRGLTLPKDDSISRRMASWENGHSEPDDIYLALLSEIFQAEPDTLLNRPRKAPEMDADEAELLLRLDTARGVDASLIAMLNAHTDLIRMKDRKLGAVVLAEEVRAHLDQVETLLRHSVFRAGRSSLAFVLADASALAGWQAVDTGSLSDAWEHFERAKAAAREADDPKILAFASAEQAYVLLDLQRPQDALTMIQQAHREDHRRLPPLMRTWLYAAEAEAYAASDDASSALRTMDVAASSLPDGTDEGDVTMSYLALNLVHLARWRGGILARLGDADAIEDLNRALAGMGSGAFTRAEAGLRCDLAGALIARGETGEAAQQIEQARRLVALSGSTRQRRRLDQLAQQL
ncbi:hypothetical protein GXW82_35475 [Streptacidiphilus sp. 4-A2]|nr:hypothetical protein [Streptacidiphilus sp. 4-A2]